MTPLKDPASPPAKQLASFIQKFTPEIATLAQAVLATMRKRYPTALELVYDNYNALAIGFSPTERTSEAIFSIALFPRWVSLFFLQGAKLPDPDKTLKGSGTRVRHIILTDRTILEQPGVKKLMALALKSASLMVRCMIFPKVAMACGPPRTLQTYWNI